MNKEEREKQELKIKFRKMLLASAFLTGLLLPKGSFAQGSNEKENRSTPIQTTLEAQDLLYDLNNRDLSASERVKAFSSCLEKGVIMPKHSKSSDIEYVDKDGVLRATLTDKKLKLHTYGTEFPHKSYNHKDKWVVLKSDSVINITDVYDLPETDAVKLSVKIKFYADNITQKSSTVAEYNGGVIVQNFDNNGTMYSERGTSQHTEVSSGGTETKSYEEKGDWYPNYGSCYNMKITTYDNQHRIKSFEEIDKTPSLEVVQKRTYYPSGREKSYSIESTTDANDTYRVRTFEDGPQGRTISCYYQGQTTSFEYNGEDGYLSAVTYEKGGEKVKIPVINKHNYMYSGYAEDYAELPFEVAKNTSAENLDKAVIMVIADSGLVGRGSIFYEEVFKVWDQRRAQEGQENSQTGKALPSQQTTR